MIKTSVIERYADGQAIVTEGIISTKAYIILSGKTKVLKKMGDKNVVIGLLKKGDIFGEMGLIGKSARTASVVAVGDVNLGIIDKKLFEKILKEIPPEMCHVVRALIERLKMTTSKLAQVAVQFESVRNTMSSLSTKTTDNS